MKRKILILILLAVCIGCAPQTEKPNAALHQQPAATAIEETLSLQTSASEPTPVESPVPTEAPAAPESPAPDVLQLKNVAASEPLREPVPLDVTIREFDWSKADPKGDYETKYRTETIDFADLCISLDELFADETHTRLKLHIRHPQAWTKLQSQNMNGWFLHVAVLLDGKQVPFVLKAKSVQLGFDTQNERCDDYFIVLESDEINMHTLAAYKELGILPVVLWHSYRDTGGYYWRTDADGTTVATTLTRPHWPLAPRITELDARKVSVDLAKITGGIAPQPIEKREPLMRTVTVLHEDIQRMLDEDAYTREGENIPSYGYYENETVDVSDIRIQVVQCQVTDLNILLLARIDLPEEWTPEQTWNYGRRALDFALMIDGRNAAGKAFSGIRDLTMTRYPALRIIPQSADDPQNFDVKTIWCKLFASREYADFLLDAKEICIVPMLRHDKKMRVQGKVFDLDREPTPYDANIQSDILDWDETPVWELAAYIDPSTLIVSKEVN